MTCLLGSAAYAHANYASSSPRPNERLDRAPDKVTVSFSEAADPKGSGLQVLASDGTVVATGGAPTAPDTFVLATSGLTTGPYTVLWHTVSAVDGDAAHGFFAFTVGADDAAAGALHFTGDQSAVRATLDITPARLGTNEYRVTVTDGSGNSVPTVTRVRLRIERAAPDLGVAFTDLAQAGSAYAASGMDLALRGAYQITVEVRRRDVLSDLMYVFTVSVPAPVAASPSATSSVGSTASAGASPTATSAPAPSNDVPVLAIAAIVVIALLAGAGLLVRRR